MKTLKSRRFRLAAKAFSVVALIGTFGGGLSTPVLADRREERPRDDRRREDERRGERRYRAQELHRHSPTVIYAPAPVVEMPPPPSPGLSFVFPIHIR